jgi:probable phosphoglycerate mutase
VVAVGRHTGRTDIPLTERGECNARRLRARLEGITFTEVLVSPLQRARRTCELAGFAAVAKVTPDLIEWDYGDYDGRLTSDIRRERPGCQSSGGVPGTPYLTAWLRFVASSRAVMR